MASWRALTVAIALSSISIAASQGAWKDGRASYYGLDAWSIHKGSCGFGYQWPDIYPGFDVAAISDASPEFSGSCGRCYEVKCRDGNFTDGYGMEISRTGVCLNPGASLTIRTVDNCPCYYPANEYSNKRWCCGDPGAGAAHMDLSVWAFERLAPKKLGVMAISFREVPCDYRPPNHAPKAADPSPPQDPWPGAKRPDQQVYVKRFDAVGGPQGAVTAVADESQAGGKPIVPVSQLYRDGTFVSTADPPPPPPPPTAPSPEGPCDDKQPTGSTCQQNKDAGKCMDGWLTSGGYCRQTCGACIASMAGMQLVTQPELPKPLNNATDVLALVAAFNANSPRQQAAPPAPEKPQTPSLGKLLLPAPAPEKPPAPVVAAAAAPPAPAKAAAADPPPAAGPAPAPAAKDPRCDDKQPATGASCAQQKTWGKCKDAWLVTGGYCRKTCGVCGGPPAPPAAPQTPTPAAPPPLGPAAKNTSAPPGPPPAKPPAPAQAPAGGPGPAPSVAKSQPPAGPPLSGSKTPPVGPPAPSATPAAVSKGPPPPATPPAPAKCDDKQPKGSTCAAQKAQGNCKEGWLVSGGYCQATCDACGAQVKSLEAGR